MTARPSHEEYRQEICSFLQQHVVEKDAELCASNDRLKRMWRQAGEAGVFRGAGVIDYGGYCDRQYSLIVMEELGRHLLLDVPFWLQADVIVYFLQQYGTPEQKDRYLRPLIEGRKIGAFCLTEPHGGSDIQLIRTTATRVDDGYTLTGKKKVITNGSIADLYLVVCQLKEEHGKGIAIFCVDAEQAGVSATAIDTRNAMRALDLADVQFDDVHVPTSARLGNTQHMSLAILKGLTIERFANSVLCQEMAHVLIAQGVWWSRRRHNGRESVMDHQHIRYTFAEQEANVQMAQAFVDGLKRRYLDGKRLQSRDAAIAKYKTTSHLISISTFLAHVFGARTVTGEATGLDILRVQNDAIAQSIAGGTDEIMKKIISEGFAY